VQNITLRMRTALHEGKLREAHREGHVDEDATLELEGNGGDPTVQLEEAGEDAAVGLEEMRRAPEFSLRPVGGRRAGGGNRNRRARGGSGGFTRLG
jgi:hypothetical protein